MEQPSEQKEDGRNDADVSFSEEEQKDSDHNESQKSIFEDPVCLKDITELTLSTEYVKVKRESAK